MSKTPFLKIFVNSGRTVMWLKFKPIHQLYHKMEINSNFITKVIAKSNKT